TQIERVEPGERNELELVAHLAQFPLEACDRSFIQLLLPVEGRRAVVRKQLAGIFEMNGLSEAACLCQIRFGSFAPEHIGVRRKGEPPRNRLIKSAAHAEEAFSCPLAGNKGIVAVVNIAG